MPAVLQVNYEHSWSDEEMEALSLDWAINVKPTIPGLRWKVFAKQSAEQRAGGYYLFDDVASAEAYLAGEVWAAVKSAPQVKSAEVRIYELMEEPSLAAGVSLEMAKA